MTQRRIYQEEYPYFITFRTIEGYPLFNKTKYVALLACVILKTGRLKQYDILAWQIMPDHVHILAYTKYPRAWAAAPALASIRRQYGLNYPFFQPRFYTRVINTTEYLATIIDYIQNNPIKENLPKKFQQRPYQYFDRRKINAFFA